MLLLMPSHHISVSFRDGETRHNLTHAPTAGAASIVQARIESSVLSYCCQPHSLNRCNIQCLPRDSVSLESHIETQLVFLASGRRRGMMRSSKDYQVGTTAELRHWAIGAERQPTMRKPSYSLSRRAQMIDKQPAPANCIIFDGHLH